MALQRAAQLWACLVFAIFCGTAYADAPGKGPSIPVAYCSSQNTGANFKPCKSLPGHGFALALPANIVVVISIYQSEGRCYGNCTDAGYALAIVQEKNCWCSNYIPNKADQKSEKECQESCPGYPTDFCGGIGRYGYLQLNAEPSGTASPANPSPGSTDSDTSTSSVSHFEPIYVVDVSLVLLCPFISYSLSPLEDRGWSPVLLNRLGTRPSRPLKLRPLR